MHDITTGGHSHPHVHTADGHEVPEGVRIETGPIAQQPNGNRQLWIDASQGAAGDMLLAALIDAGADAGSIAAVLDLVAPGKLHLQSRRVQRGPFDALKIDVIADEPNPPARHLSDIVHMLRADGIPRATRDLALTAFQRLAEAEASVHGTTVEDVHFHEVGALDSIGDIVGVAEAIRTLGVLKGISSIVAVGSGTVQTQHGLLTVPPPAVMELAKGWQVEAGGPPEAGELTTPTGMALIRTLCQSQGMLPTITLDGVGTGAGTRVRKDRPGVVRVVLGTAVDNTLPEETPFEVREISANVDDLDPRLWPAVLDRLLDAGAVDAWLTPIIMKKGRPAHTVSALAARGDVTPVVEALVSHTSTIGVRIAHPSHRRVLQRIWRPINVDGHTVRIKISGDGAGSRIQQATAEFVDVQALAEALGVAERVALARAHAVAWEAELRPGAPWPEVSTDE
ncbi:MAG: nickel pincer cofactor biosynthesis protein LarC [Propionibacteriaceae bacterium]|nr:nickel pincer cofactor biosynthesis protein LarC [Propionibacteriaceae bacterium]